MIEERSGGVRVWFFGLVVFPGFTGFRISQVFGSDFESSSTGTIQNIHLVFFNACVTILEGARGQILQHLWSTWRSDFLSDFQIWWILGFESRFRFADHGIIGSTHLVPVNIWVTLLDPWPDLSTFMVHMVVGFWSDSGISGIPGFESIIRLVDQGIFDIPMITG